MAGSTDENVVKLRELIQDIDFGMLTTTGDDGTIHSRPMSSNGDVEADGSLWFFTYGSSHKVEEIGKDRNVNVSFADPSHQRYVSVSGTAELVRDREKIRELWKPIYKAWFPQGVDEPDIALLKVQAKRAEYWDSPSGKVAQIIGLAKALATGETYTPGEHEELELEAVAR